MHIILPTPKWDKTIDGLDFGGYAQFAEKLELSLLPPGTIFPKAGQIWEAIHDCEVFCTLRMAQPGPPLKKVQVANGTVFMSGLIVPGAETRLPWAGKVVLPKGEQLCVVDFAGCGSTTLLQASLQPVRYEELHASMVEEKFRALPGYKGYSLSVRTARSKWCVVKEPYLNEDFFLVKEV